MAEDRKFDRPLGSHAAARWGVKFGLAGARGAARRNPEGEAFRGLFDN